MPHFSHKKHRKHRKKRLVRRVGMGETNVNNTHNFIHKSSFPKHGLTRFDGFIHSRLFLTFYGEDRAKSILERLKAAKVETEVPIIIHWEEGEATIFYNKLILPLSFITRTSESISLVNYNKAYSRFIETIEGGT